MKKYYYLILIISLSVLASCKNQAPTQFSNEAIWQLNWRMVNNSIIENFELAELQFDSLLQISNKIESNFLVTGLEIKHKLKKDRAIEEILSNQNDEMLRQICKKEFLHNQISCKDIPEEIVEDKKLQLELIQMYINDQAARGSIMKDVIAKYSLNEEDVTQSGAINVDEQNRNRLKEIFEDIGFPTKRLVGRDAMYGIFLIIQHADMDKEWQKSQLPNIEKAVKNGDLVGRNYAYLYDRIKVNSGQKQLYGTQFAKVDRAKKIVELADTEDLEQLNERRRAMGMMPIEMYKKLPLRNL